MRSHAHALLSLLLTLTLGAAGALAQEVRAQALDDTERAAVVLTLRLDEEGQRRLDELALACTVERQRHIDASNAEREGMPLENEFDFAEYLEHRLTLERELAAIRNTMLEDLALLLDEDAPGRVERCVMRLDRLQIVRETFEDQLTGFSADPVTVSVEIGLPMLLPMESAEAYDAAMHAYDRAMKPRLDGFIELRDEAFTSMVERGDPSPDNPAFMEFMARLIDHVFDMREVHKSRARAIAATLPHEMRPAWDHEWNRQAFPDIYEPMWSERAIARVVRSGVLTPGEREAVLEYEREIEPALAGLRDRWAKALDQAESSMSASELIESDGPSSPALSRALRRVYETDIAAYNALKRLIDPLRHGVLPEPPADPDADEPSE